MDIRVAAESSVLPGKVNDGACKPDIAVYLCCSIIICCRFLVGADEVDKIGEWVEG